MPVEVARGWYRGSGHRSERERETYRRRIVLFPVRTDTITKLTQHLMRLRTIRKIKED
jgi:hypothetical protein